ncbi:polysaccharide pyruvyl transferase family protein [Turicibacter sanguinis]|uniref:polysaccharide pyruvyl transferase family protein n=1 Tax=Turicibacter sanguinis TaxID=154288 RepID=UPI0018A9AAB8|nr:polysaccharide pyruvyl transferase family protein [Turicibacter sanguinis]MDB8558413.1 polysaccharide pyruvyl transferase family protein [Turicibacter sanguinis]MDB8561209.1 polysaccharide pyruvyl transferase family protein [Turicibacter sanguinis]
MAFFSKLTPCYLRAWTLNLLNKNLIRNKYFSFRNTRKIIIIGTPTHKNIGDHAIALAEIEFIKKIFPDRTILELDMDEYYNEITILKKYCSSSDIIILQGGGNFGDEYLYDEQLRRHAIQLFKENKIILFPQTLFFSNSLKGRIELENSIKIYSQNNNLTLVAREQYSYNEMLKYFPHNSVILTPDIVFSLKRIDNKRKRNGALLCLRDDQEQILSNDEKNEIKFILTSFFSSVKNTDMKASHRINKKQRLALLEEKFKEFQESELVITDRLHGMIFATITGTPCIALSNYNHKISGTYEWIKEFEYIKFTRDIGKIPLLIEELSILEVQNYRNDFMNFYFNKIKEVMG